MVQDSVTFESRNADIPVALADGLLTMPCSLRAFNLLNQRERPWKRMMTGLNVLLSDTDFLSQNILNLSLSLKELKIDQLSLTPDFLFPLDTESHPLPTSRSLYWPSLEVVELTVPPILPSGAFIDSPSTVQLCPFVCNTVSIQTGDIICSILLIIAIYRPVDCTSNTRGSKRNRRDRRLGENNL